jgi:signal transduction histidine kinase
MPIPTVIRDLPMERLVAARDRYLSGDPNPPGVRPVVLAAWERSRAYDVNPYRLRRQTPDPTRLKAARNRSTALMESAEPFLRLVNEALADEPHLVVLADADCTVLRALTGPGLPDDLEASNLVEGASWHERDLGSNGVGTAMETGEPVILVGPEHFQDSYVGWTCIGVPIRDGDGKLVGAFDLSVPNENANAHAWGWALSLGRGIETALQTGGAATRQEAEQAVSGVERSIQDLDSVLALLGEEVDRSSPAARTLERAHGELRSMRAELGRASRRVERAIGERDRLLALVNHDLRAPLSTITMATALLFEDSPEEKRKAQAVTIRRATDQMTRLVQDLLDVSQIEVGRLGIAVKPCRADALVRSAVESCAPLARSRSLTLQAEPETERVVRADAQRVLQVFTNLISNAIEHTPEGGRITVRAQDAERSVLFQVDDTGSGIAPEHLPHVFDRFWQANRARRAGAGLGLAISRGIVEAHGGEMGVESEPDGGSTFHFTLPLQV